jgi:hypothetical protein
MAIMKRSKRVGWSEAPEELISVKVLISEDAPFFVLNIAPACVRFLLAL